MKKLEMILVKASISGLAFFPKYSELQAFVTKISVLKLEF